MSGSWSQVLGDREGTIQIKSVQRYKVKKVSEEREGKVKEKARNARTIDLVLALPQYVSRIYAIRIRPTSMFKDIKKVFIIHSRSISLIPSQSHLVFLQCNQSFLSLNE